MAKTGELALNEETLAMCIELAGDGAPNYIIARAINVHPDSYQRWIRLAKEEADSDDPSIFKRLHDGVEQERALLAIEMSRVVIETAKSRAPNTWQAAMTFLERRYPADWGKRETTIHEGNQGGQALPNINVLVLNDSDARSAHEDLLRSLSAAASPRGLPVGPSDAGPREDGQERELDN